MNSPIYVTFSLFSPSFLPTTLSPFPTSPPLPPLPPHSLTFQTHCHAQPPFFTPLSQTTSFTTIPSSKAQWGVLNCTQNPESPPFRKNPWFRTAYSFPRLTAYQQREKVECRPASLFWQWNKKKNSVRKNTLEDKRVTERKRKKGRLELRTQTTYHIGLRRRRPERGWTRTRTEMWFQTK